MLEHSEIGWIERTGYPSWMQDVGEFEEDENSFDDEPDYDAAYEECRDSVRLGV